MQDGAQNSSSIPEVSGRLLGFVRVVVGGQVFSLAVQSVSFEKDGDKVAGGFFASEGQYGILVDGEAPAPEVQAQIEKATAEAVRHLSQKCLN